MNRLLDKLRRLRAALRQTARDHAERLFYLLSEYEAISARAGTRQPARARYLWRKGVRHGKHFYVGRGFWIHNGTNFVFGDRCSLGEFARVLDHGPVIIGDDFIAATGLQINSGTHDPVTMRPVCAPVVIGNRVWCGANVTILAGVTIGDDVVLGAGSLVRTSIPAGSIAAGVPARVIRPLDRPSPPQTWLPQA